MLLCFELWMFLTFNNDVLLRTFWGLFGICMNVLLMLFCLNVTIYSILRLLVKFTLYNVMTYDTLLELGVGVVVNVGSTFSPNTRLVQ